MPPTTRSSTKKATVVDAREIVSWTSTVTGETLFYERFHAYDEEQEILFVQLRRDEQGDLVPWTKDEEDGTKEICLKSMALMLIRCRRPGS
ncbi:unnamed protein product [Aureobasidium mustum]|uniref:Uncharacterized protein n=1 Tax=Aureobasidium mustum TaxID=2773714 RepID=A0A9N8PB41_9PEZI|nr:unnamed protein product [Aureobasidium mustum]